MSRSSRSCLLTLGLTAAWCGGAFGHSYAINAAGFQDGAKLTTLVQNLASSNQDIDEWAVTPSGEWIVVRATGSAAQAPVIQTSAGFPKSVAAKVAEFANAGHRIDAVAFTPTGSWVVIGDGVWWHAGSIARLPSLQDRVAAAFAGNLKVKELQFDFDGDGFVFLAQNYTWVESVRADVTQAITDGGASKRTPTGGALSFDGRFAYLADDWFASAKASGGLYSRLTQFQREQRRLDHVLIAQGGGFAVFSEGAYLPTPGVGIEAIEYGMQYTSASGTPVTTNIWQRMRDLNIAGVTVAVVDDGQIQWARGYGELEKGTQRFVQADSPFDTASMSKFVGSTAIVRFLEGSPSVSLDSSVAQQIQMVGSTMANPVWTWATFSPSMGGTPPVPTSQITFRRLLSHSASLEPWSSTPYLPGAPVPPSAIKLLGGVWANGQWQPSIPNMVLYNPNILGDGTPTPPGTATRYSGGGFLLAETMVETFTGQPFSKYAKTVVLDKLGMNDSTFAQPLSASFAARAAVPHDGNGNAVPVAQRPNYFWAVAGGLYASAADYAKVVIAQMNLGTGANGVQILSPSSAQATMTKQAATSNYGFGLSLSAPLVTTSNDRWFTHNGGHAGASTRMAGNPTRREAIVVMVNGGSSNASKFREEVRSAFASFYGW